MMRNYIKNLIGWKTNRKIIVFSIDDYGNVRLASRQARENLDKSGLKVLNRFDAYDTLETTEDLSALFDILYSVKDKNGNPVVFTAFTVPANINFEKMAEQNYQNYFYELLPDTFEKLKNIYPNAYTGTWNLWREGIDKKLIYPEFHGREHFNLKAFKKKLVKKDKELFSSLNNRCLTSISNSGYPNISFNAAFDFYKFEENLEFEHIIKDGLNIFENIFGFRAKHFNPPGGREHPTIHKYLREGGINYIDTSFIKKEHQGNGKYKKVFNYTGKKNSFGQIFLVRNCVFEPTFDRGFNWVNYTFKQVETAFKLNRPAIISSHRVNFCGHIDIDNRTKGLSALKELLNNIITKFPEVEFIRSNELGDTINIY